MTVTEERGGSLLGGVAVALGLTTVLALVGAASYLLPVHVALGVGLLGIGVPLAWAVARRAELGLVAVLFFAASLLPRELLLLPLPVGRLDLADLALGAILAISAARLFRLRAVPWPAVGLPLLAFAAWALLSAFYAVAYRDVELALVLRELRPPMYLLGCYLAASVLAGRSAISLTLVGLFLIADLTVAAVVLQQFLGGDNPLLAAMSGGAWEVKQDASAGAAFGGVRIVPPAHVLIFATMLLAGCLCLNLKGSPHWRALLGAQFLYLNLGLLLTYTRAQWVASAIAFALVALLVSGAARARLLRYALVLGTAAVTFVGLAQLGVVESSSPQFLTALTARASTILTPGETLGTGSLEWRVFETEEATRSIAENPILGVGLGNDYRPVTLFQGEASGWLWDLDGVSRLTRFIHNSYLFIAAKMGLPGIVLFASFVVTFLFGGVRTYLGARDGTSGALVLAAVCLVAGLLEWSFFQSHFMQTASMATVGTVVGLVAAIRGIAAVSDPAADPDRRFPPPLSVGGGGEA